MIRYQLLIEYMGTDFRGWQIQKKGSTIQGLIQKNLTKLLKEKIILVGSGRTDAGVHAIEQSSHFDCKNHHSRKQQFRNTRDSLSLWWPVLSILVNSLFQYAHTSFPGSCVCNEARGSAQRVRGDTAESLRTSIRIFRFLWLPHAPCGKRFPSEKWTLGDSFLDVLWLL